MNTPQEVYQHSLENEIGATRRDGLIKENMRLFRQELLALLAYRLQILIPTSEVLTKKDTRNMGAKDAISSLQDLLGALPTVEEIEISKESRLVECLVKCYVNMTSKQRNFFCCFATCLGLNAETATVFEMFVDQFMRPPEEVVMMFTSSMRQAQCHRSAYIALQENCRNTAYLTRKYTYLVCLLRNDLRDNINHRQPMTRYRAYSGYLNCAHIRHTSNSCYIHFKGDVCI